MEEEGPEKSREAGEDKGQGVSLGWGPVAVGTPSIFSNVSVSGILCACMCVNIEEGENLISWSV